MTHARVQIPDIKTNPISYDYTKVVYHITTRQSYDEMDRSYVPLV